MILNSDITVIVHGPVQKYMDRQHHEEGITKRCLDSVRQVLPGSTVVLATWEGQDLSELQFDQLIEEIDVGPNLDPVCPRNYNRQMHLTKKGLEAAVTPYSVKLRSDNFLVSDHFKCLQEDYASALRSMPVFSERVLINSNLSRMTSKGVPVAYSPSDFFYFGRTEDLRKIWCMPLFENNRNAEPLILAARTRDGHPQPEAEQVYCMLWMCELADWARPLRHRFDASVEQLERWLEFVASNIVFGEPKKIGLGLRASSRNKWRVNEFTHRDWLRLYARFGDPTLKIQTSMRDRLLAMDRFFHLPASRLWARIQHGSWKRS